MRYMYTFSGLALRLLDRAENSLLEGNRSKAEHLLGVAERFYRHRKPDFTVDRLH